MSHKGEPGHPGLPGEPGTGGGGRGGTGGEGGHGGDPGAGMTRGARHAAVFLFLVSLLLAAGNLLFTSSLVHRASASAASVTALCQAGNEARKQQIDLWTFVIQISRPPPHATHAQLVQREKVLRQFALHLHKVFAPRDCQAERFTHGPG